MGSQSLTLVVAGTQKEILLDTDPESGRTAVRLDGRPVTRPIAASEEEREFSVGSQKFILRRMPDGRFDVDYAPPDFAPGSEWVGPRASRSPGRLKGWKERTAAGSIAGIILSLVMARVCGYFFTEAIRSTEKPKTRIAQPGGPPVTQDRGTQPVREPARPYTPPPSALPLTQTVQRTPRVPSTERPSIEMAPAAQVYVVNTTKKYYPLDCAARPEGAYKMARSLATSQGFQLAAECATKTPAVR